MEKVNISPNDGGCWYCHKKCNGNGVINGPLASGFSWEFDTNVHIKCLREARERDPEDLEAKIMADELIGDTQ